MSLYITNLMLPEDGAKSIRIFRDGTVYSLRGSTTIARAVECEQVPACVWRYTELGHLPKVGEPVLIARRKNMDEPLRVEQGILLPGGKWKSFGHTFEPDNVIAWQPLPDPPEPEPF